MISKSIYLPLIAVLFCLAGAACTQERQPCLTPKIASLNIKTIHFPADTSTVTVDSALPAAVFLAITNTGLKGGYYPRQSAFTISLSSVADSCQWVISPDTTAGTLFDTLTFYYQRRLQFLSNACGYAYFYNLDSAHTTHNNIDSLHIKNSSVTNNVNTNHLQIYIHADF